MFAAMLCLCPTLWLAAKNPEAGSSLILTWLPQLLPLFLSGDFLLFMPLVSLFFLIHVLAIDPLLLVGKELQDHCCYNVFKPGWYGRSL